MIRVEHLSKHYGTVKALSDISFTVERGELFGLIGPDGSGKSSLFRILTTLIDADPLPHGGAYIAHHEETGMRWLNVQEDYKTIRANVGYMPGRFSLYQDLSVEENLSFFATLFGTTIEENYHLVEDIYRQIEPFKTRRAGKLSGGMKQKLALSCALIHKPTVLFLDEPTTGVDPVSRKEFWQMLKRLKQDGLTIVVSTPYMDEAMLCDRIALMNKGRIIRVDPPEEIIASFNKQIYAVQASQMYRLLQALRNHPTIESAFAFGDKHHITYHTEQPPRALVDYLIAKGFEQVRVEPIKPTIEDCFIAIDDEQGNSY